MLLIALDAVVVADAIVVLLARKSPIVFVQAQECKIVLVAITPRDPKCQFHPTFASLTGSRETSSLQHIG